MSEGEFDRAAALALLSEPLRRRIYEHASSAPDGVSRDGVGQALGLARSVAAFHLDKLAEAGLLTVEFRRPAGRTGPGAGRPAKWYRRAEGEFSLSVPERRYDRAAKLLAEAVERSGREGVPVAAALFEAAREEGRRLGAALAKREGAPFRERLVALLAEAGYEPRIEEGMVVLANCPFHLLAEEHRDLVCAMNHQLLTGLAEAGGLSDAAAHLQPRSGRCCVTLAA
jgi:predicted ArsR family transcriptional regulator